MWYCVPIEFSLIVFIEFAEFGDKNVCHYSKRAQTCHTATSCVRDHSATTVPVRHMWEAGSLNWRPIHASVIRWIQWIPVPFRENSNKCLFMGRKKWKNETSLKHFSQETLSIRTKRNWFSNTKLKHWLFLALYNVCNSNSFKFLLYILSSAAPYFYQYLGYKTRVWSQAVTPRMVVCQSPKRLTTYSC